MFESAELGHKIDAKTYSAMAADLRAELLDAQYDIGQAKRFSVLILVNGVDGAGKGETVNLLNEWMDPRHIMTRAFGDPTDEELHRPMMWRYWRALPPKGKIGIFFHNWYTDPIGEQVEGGGKRAALEEKLAAINRFEKMLADEGMLILKFWFHLSKDAQRKRLKALEKDPLTRWRITENDWRRFKRYDEYRQVSEHVLRETSMANAPWTVVDGSDPRYRAITVGNILLDAMRRRLAWQGDTTRRITAAPLRPAIDRTNLLNSLDLTRKLEKKKYEVELEKLQGRLNALVRNAKFQSRSLIIVFEGPDAAGKGGAIRRITSALDARQYAVVPIAAPTEEELAQPYLWRFWRHLPRKGRVVVFDRSWYGRVLVERVEGFCSEADWMRAYSEINDFEEQLTESGVVVVKFWLAISKEEQFRRFKEREETRFKRFKITEEDWRNREKWDAYEAAVCDMVDRTSTEIAQWTLVEADDKLHARIKVLKTLCERLEGALKDDGKHSQK